MKDAILLDSDSNATMFCNENFAKKIWDADSSVYADSDGDGRLACTKRCEAPCLGEHLRDSNSITNIISLSDATDKHKVTMGTEKEKAMVVHFSNKIVKFAQLSNRLWGLIPDHQDEVSSSTKRQFIFRDPNKYNKSLNHKQFVSTVEENRKHVSEADFARAVKAQKAYEALGTPTVQDLKAAIRMNLIKDNEITSKDMDLAEKAFGPGAGNLKGKTARSTPEAVQDESIETPRESLDVNHDVILSIDGMPINSLDFLTSISHGICYRTAAHLPNSGYLEIKEKTYEIINIYEAAGFKVVEMHADKGLKKAMDIAGTERKIRINYANSKEHVPRAERNNRTIQERVRASYHQLPYDHLPEKLVVAMVMEAAKKLNFFPVKYGASKHCSPRMMLHQENITFKQHCPHALGECVQAEDELLRTNKNAPRTLDCIYPRPSANRQLGHDLSHLPTNKIINRKKIFSVPVTTAVINQTHNLATAEDMPKGLKIKNRTGSIFSDSSWTAGVEHASDSESDSEDEENYENDSSEDAESYAEDDSSDNSSKDSFDKFDRNDLAEVLENQCVDPDDLDYHGNDVANEVQEQEANEINNNNNKLEEDEENNNQSDIQNENANDRPRRNARPPDRFRPCVSHVQSTDDEENEATASALARIICHYQEKHLNNKSKLQLGQTRSLKKGLKALGNKAKDAACQEMNQIRRRGTCKPVLKKDLTKEELTRAMESLMFLEEKRDGRTKARTCANGSTQRGCISKEESTSPTAATEAMLIAGVIEAKEGRDIMTLDMPNAFLQTKMPKGESGERTIMKFRGVLVDMLCEIDPETYSEYVAHDGGNNKYHMSACLSRYMVC